MYSPERRCTQASSQLAANQLTAIAVRSFVDDGLGAFRIGRSHRQEEQ
jgi:hypothetical protein